MRHFGPLVVLVLESYAFAGDEGVKSYKCKADTQACLNEMSARLRSRGWLGIEMDQNEETRTITVTRIVPGGPAEEAGFRVGDLLLALNGIDLCTEHRAEESSKIREALVPGALVEYSVRRAGSEMKIRVKLAELPADVMAQMIGQHMLEHHVKTEAAKK